MKKILYFFVTVLLLLPVVSWGQTAGDYRSTATGNWNSTSTWERYDGASWVAAVATPTSADGAITIRNGHIVSITATVTYDQVTVESGGQVTVESAVTSTLANGTGTDLTINGTWLNSGGTWTVTGATWAVSSGGTFIHNTTSGISTPLGVATLDAASNFIYRGSSTLNTSVAVSGRTYGNLTFESTSGTWVASPVGSSALTINGSLTVSSNATLNLNVTGTPGHSIKGNISVASGATLNFNPASSGTVNINGTSPQSIGGAGTFSTQANSVLSLANSNGVSLTGNLSILGSITSVSTLLNLGNYNLTLGSSSAITGAPSATNMVIATGSGELRKTFTASGSYIFPVGDNSGTAEYSPVTLNFTSGTFSSAYAGVKLSNTKHTSNSSTTDYLNRYWTVTSSGISAFSCDVTLNYVDADINGTEANIYGGHYNGSSWTLLNAATTASNQLTGTVTSFSDFTGGEQSALPVQLTSFTASTVEGGVKLNWETATEVNNYGFNVERLANSQQLKANSWEKIGFVQGNGNSNSPKSYSFTDNAAPAGKVQYRLKQMDFDGKFEYSAVAEVEVETPNALVLYQNSPNPFNPETVIRYKVQATSQVTLKVYDLLGNEVATLVNEVKEPGSYNSQFSIFNFSPRSTRVGAGQLSSGVYFYRLTANGISETKKMILMK